jgi:hypothetical protein
MAGAASPADERGKESAPSYPDFDALDEDREKPPAGKPSGRGLHKTSAIRRILIQGLD